MTSSNSSNSNSTPAPTYKNMFAASAVRKSGEVVNISHFTREYRAQAQDKEHLALVGAITKPLSIKMTHLDFSKLEDLNEEVFVTNEKLENFMIELASRLTYYGMNDLLEEHIILGEATNPNDDRTRFDPGTTGEVVNFMKDWDQTGPGKKYTPEKVAEANAWKLKYTLAAYEMVLKDGKLLHDLLVNSMSSELKDTVMSELHNNYSPEARSGSLTFVIMLQYVINLSKPAVEGLKRSLEKQTLKNIPGQNVYLLARRVLYGLDRLQHNNAAPHDVNNLIFDMMMTSSVPEFNTWIEHWKNSISFTDVEPSYRDVLKRIVVKYQELCVGGFWNGVGKDSEASAFNATTSESESKAKSNDSKDSKGTKGKQTSVWRDPTPDEFLQEDPPQYGMVIKKKLMMWCAKCENRNTGKVGRWNTTLFTDACGAGKTQANVATTSKPDSKAEAAETKTASSSFKQALLDSEDTTE